MKQEGGDGQNGNFFSRLSNQLEHNHALNDYVHIYKQTHA